MSDNEKYLRTKIKSNKYKIKECKYIMKEKKMNRYINDDVEIFSDDSGNSDEEAFDESDEESSNESDKE